MKEIKYHEPVLLEETVNLLEINDANVCIDATLGFGGHSDEIIKKLNPSAILLGIDQDSDAINYCIDKFNHNSAVKIHHANFSNWPLVLKKEGLKSADRILMDLGMSSYQIDNSERGFTFQNDEILDMRMDTTQSKPTAADLLNTASPETLSQIMRDYADLRHAGKFIENILEERAREPYKTTGQLLKTLRRSFYIKSRSAMMGLQAKIFQGIRIEVNAEYHHLEMALNALEENLAEGGRIAIITFHSGEDRMVKRFIKNAPYLEPINKKVIKHSYHETKHNPRARSAKLRVALKKTP